MTEDKEFVFDLTPTEIPIKVGGTDYILREANGEAARKYRTACLTGTEMDLNEDTGTQTIRRIQAASEVESLLVSLCLFDTATDPSGIKKVGNPVPRKTIESWPSRIQRKLFDKAKEISQLDETEDIDKLLKQKSKLEARIARMEREQQAAKNLRAGATEGEEKNQPS